MDSGWKRALRPHRWRSRRYAHGALLACALALAAPSDALGQQRCYFLECPGGQTTSTQQEPPRALPTPPQATPQPTPKAAPQRPRPTASSEVCGRSAGITYCGSSVLAPQQGNTYVPLHMVDGRLETAWVEGKPGDGIGDWVVADFDAVKRVRSVQIMNGYHKNEELFRRNNRVREADLVFADGTRARITLEDRGGVQTFRPDAAIYSSWVQVVIVSVYKGTRYADTAITELRIETSD